MSIRKDIAIDMGGRRKPFAHFFRATGYANADYTYTPAVTRMYDYLSSYQGHPLYMRLHNIMSLHGKGDYYKVVHGFDYGNPISNVATGIDIVVKRQEDGSLGYDWTYVDKVYDIIMGHGMKPIVEMVYMPTAIMHPEWPCLPQDYNEYYECVRAFVQHWTDRYGREEVRTWYFEIINEPENYDIVNERPEKFMALYDYFEAAVHSIDEEYRAGGPAVKQWENGKRVFDLFLSHCDDGVNYYSGKYGTRLDFISVHCKGGHPTMVGPQMEYMFNSLREYAEMLKKHPKYADTPFFNDESDIVWEGNMGISHKSWLNFRNTEYAPGFICKMVNWYCDVIQDELGLNLTVVDSDNSHLPWEVHLFSGNRSQLTPLANAPCTDIVRKGFFNAGQILGRLGSERLIIDSDDPEFGTKYGCIATAYENNGGYAFLLWNFEDGLSDDVNERHISFRASGLGNTEKLRPVAYRIDHSHSNSYGIWAECGKPFPIDETIAQKLRMNDSLCPVEEDISIADGICQAEIDLPMHSVVLMILAPEGEKEDLRIKEASVFDDYAGNPAVFLNWDYSKRSDFIGYNIYRDGEKINGRPVSGSCLSDSPLEKGRTYHYSIETVYAHGTEAGNDVSVTV